jgi:CDP-diacylglycerol--serine O-phosphatidyltransferase
VDAVAKRYFVGLPIPAGAGLIASVVHFWQTPLANPGSSLLWCILIAITSFLMISTIRYHNFKHLGIFSRRPRIVLVTAALMIGLIFKYSEQMLLLLAVVYVSSGPLGKLHQMVRKVTAHVTPENQSSMETRREP